MRRTVLALVGFTLAVAVLVGLKSPGSARLLGWSAEAGLSADPVSGDGVLPSTSDAASATPGSSGPGRAPAATASAGAPTTSVGPRPSASTAAPAATTPPVAATRTILGPAVATVWDGHNYGTTQVKIVVTGTHIDDIVAVKQGSRPGSTATTLRTQALAAQSANVGNVSGATASSNAYKQSLQGAINQI